MTRQLDRAFWAACPFRQPRHRFRDGQGLALVGIGRTWERYWQTVRVANAWRPTLLDLARVGIVDDTLTEACRTMARGEA